MHQFLAIEHNDAQIPPSQLKGNRAANDAATHDDDVICVHKIILAVNPRRRTDGTIGTLACPVLCAGIVAAIRRTLSLGVASIEDRQECLS